MISRWHDQYVVYTVEYMVGVGLVNEPVYYLLGIYKTEEEAIQKKNKEEEEAYRLGYTHLKFYMEEIQVFDSKLNPKNPKKTCHEMQDTKRRWW